MLPYQKLVYPCPFCDKETILVLYRPSYKAARRSRSAGAGGKLLGEEYQKELRF